MMDSVDVYPVVLSILYVLYIMVLGTRKWQQWKFVGIFKFKPVVQKLTNIFYAMGYNRLKELCWKEQKFENQYGSNICFAPNLSQLSSIFMYLTTNI